MNPRAGWAWAGVWLCLAHAVAGSAQEPPPAAAPPRSEQPAAPGGQRVSIGQLLAGPRTSHAPPEPEPAQIARRLAELERRPDGAAARSAIAAGVQALERARARLAAGDRDGAARATQVAWAALSLATQRVAAAAQQTARLAAERRAQQAEERLEEARARLARTKARLAGTRGAGP